MAIETNSAGAAAGGARVFLIVAVVMSAVLEILDSTIVNVALPHIKAAFGATADQTTWVLSSYIVVSVVMMPLTGFMARRFGRRNLILTSIVGFAACSMLCGLSWSLDSIVVFRLMQGAFGAFLIPLSQSILFDAFPKEKRGQAMAMFGLGVVVAPVFGPTLGAILTETFSWRMVFFVNLPIAAFAIMLMLGELPKDDPEDVRIDWITLGFMALGIGALQYVLDQGRSLDWFDSRVIQAATFVSAVGLVVFVWRGLAGREDKLVDLSLYRDRNFTVATMAISGFAVAMFGGIAILPLFVQDLLDFPVMDAGLLFMPRGVAAGFSMVLTGAVLQPRFDARILAGLGVILTAIGNFMMGWLNLDASFWQLAWPGVVQGLGMGLIFVPLSTLAFNNVSSERQNEASGLYGLTRQLGSSVGIAIIGAEVVRHTAVHSAQLVEHITPYSAAARAYLAPLGASPDTARGAALLTSELQRQASLMAYTDIFTLLGWLSLALLPVLMFAKRPATDGQSHAPAMSH